MNKDEIVPTEFSYEVKLDHHDHHQLRIVIDNVGTFGFNIGGLSEEHREWLVSVVTRQMKEIHEKSFKLGRDTVINKFKSIFGLLK